MKKNETTTAKFNFMNGLILTNDDETLKQVIYSLIEELDEEGFDEEEINEFILLKVKRYLGI